MGKKIFLFLFVMLFSMSFISANINDYYCKDYGIGIGFKDQQIISQNEDYLFSTHIYNSTSGTPLSNTSSYCAFHLYDFNGNHLIADNSIDFGINIYDFYLNINAANFSEAGIYPYVYACFTNDNKASGVCSGSFNVTPTGEDLTTQQVYLILFVLSLIFILLAFSIYGINRAEKGEWQIFYVCVSYILLFCLFFLLWSISKNYLYEIPTLERIFWIIWLVMSIMFFPFLIFVSSYIIKKQAEQLMKDDLMKQGYTSEEAKELSKRKRS